MRLGRWLFPKWSWAFPVGSHHQLIRAAIGADEQQSLEAARSWLTEHNINDAQFRDHRLLLAIVSRFGQTLGDHAAYPRLVGLQRMLWTKSRLAIQEATATLQSLRAAGIELLLIKGASRLALDEAAGKQRVAWDIDVVVKPECMLRAFDILIAENWSPSPGTSPQYLRERLASTRGMNLFRGDFGDLDLHSRPFHPGQGGENEDAVLWDAALPASFAGTTVCIPRRKIELRWHWHTAEWTAIRIAIGWWIARKFCELKSATGNACKRSSWRDDYRCPRRLRSTI